MKSLFIEKVAKMESPVFLSYNKKNALLTELVSLASAETVNVHSPEYMKVSEIIACYEKITGDKLSKTYIKTHKREDFVALAEAAYDYEGAAYEDDCDEMEKDEFDYEAEYYEQEKAQDESEAFRAELESQVDLCNEGIGPDVVVDNSIPVLSEDQARTLMTKLIRHASNNKVKAFVHKQIVNSVIIKELTGKSLAGRKLSEFPEQEIHKASEIKHLLVQAGLVPYKSGFMIKPFCMAGAYKNSVITYRAKNNTLYAINTCNKTITNMATGEMVDATKKNCAYLNKAQLVGITAA